MRPFDPSTGSGPIEAALGRGALRASRVPFLACVALLCAVAVHAQTPDPETLVRQGRNLFSQGKYDDAERALNSALESAPEGAWSNGNLGTFYIFARGDYDKAIPALRKTVSIMDYGMAREGLALALYERWGDAYLRKADNATLARLWHEAQAESSDARSMWLVSASYAGTGKAARALLEHFNIEIGTSFGPLHGRIWRIGTMGYNARCDAVLHTLGALEAVLAAEGGKPPRGAAVDAALAVYMKA